MRFSRITRIRGHRVFRDFVWPSNLLEFGQFNLIYGWNGAGKTTLSALFAYIERRENVAGGDIEFEIDGTTRISGSSLSSANVPKVKVFNRDFIQQNVLEGGTSLSPIYFLGKESADRQREINRLVVDRDAAQVALDSAATRATAAGKLLDTFAISTARAIKQRLQGGGVHRYNGYDKADFAADVKSLDDTSARARSVTEDEERALVQQKDEKLRAAIQTVPGHSLNLGALAMRTVEVVGRSVTSDVIDKLACDRETSSWVQRGLTLHAATDECQFCEGTLSATRRDALNRHFNDAVRTLQQDLNRISIELNRACSEVQVVAPDVHAFYDDLHMRYQLALTILGRCQSLVAARLGDLEQAVERRKTDVLTTQGPTASTGVDLQNAEMQLSAALAEVNAVIETHGRKSASFVESISVARDRLAWSAIANAFSEHRELQQKCDSATQDCQRSLESVARLNGEIARLEREVRQHRHAADELNTELRSYLGREELTFAVEENGYVVRRGDVPATHLSEGERTAIAFLYFLKSLNDRDFDLTEGVVVIDDPVSSLDANALFSAFGYMQARSTAAGQLFVLTHSFAFFRLVKNWFHHLPKQGSSKPARRPGRLFSLTAVTGVSGQRTSSLGPIDPMLEEYDSEYHFLFKRIREEALRDDGTVPLSERYPMPNLARRLVEAFLAFRHPDCSGQNALHAALRKVGFDEGRKTRILRFINTHSHSGRIGDPGEDLFVLAETGIVLRDILELIEAVDHEHFEALVRRTSTSSQEVH